MGYKSSIESTTFSHLLSRIGGFKRRKNVYIGLAHVVHVFLLGGEEGRDTGCLR